MGNNLFKPIPHSVFYCANDNNDKKCSVKLTKAMIFTATDGSWLNSKSDQCCPTTLLINNIIFLYIFSSHTCIDPYILNKITTFQAIQSHGSDKVIKYFLMRNTKQHDKAFALK
jgi:hypothetical protein